MCAAFTICVYRAIRHERSRASSPTKEYQTPQRTIHGWTAKNLIAALILAGAAFFLFVIRLKKSEFNPSEKAKKIIDLFCGCSFGIYLIHILFLDNYKKYMEPTDLTAWIAVPALIISIAAVSFACVWVLRRTSIGRKIA